MVNQRQIIAAVQGADPVYQGNDADFFTIVSRFEGLYDAYNDFQRRLERYWALRWIEQEGLKEITAAVIKEDLVRAEDFPFVQRIPGLPELERGRRVRLAVLGFDYIELVLETKLIEVLPESAGLGDVDDEEDDDAAAAQTDVPQTEENVTKDSQSTAEIGQNSPDK